MRACIGLWAGMSALFRCWGTRGSVPRSGIGFTEFGGATSCYQISLDGRCIVLDAGTGIVALGEQLLTHPPCQIDLVLTHFHLDHVMGLPFFAPLFASGFHVRIWSSDKGMPMNGADMMDALLQRPFMPIRPHDLSATVTFHSFGPDHAVDMAEGVRMQSLPLIHPGGNAALKFHVAGASLVYSGDFEWADAARNRALAAFIAGVDLAVLDCTLAPEDVTQGRAFGHVDWRHAGQLGQHARRWIGTHHHHLATDLVLRDREAQIKTAFPTGGLARDGMEIALN